MHDVASKQLNWAAIREDFPILEQEVHGYPLIYFDSAASSQKPRAVVDALRHYYEHDHANVHRGLHELSARATALYEGARQRTADYLGAASADETDHSSEYVADELGIDVEDLRRWEDQQLDSQGLTRNSE